MQFNISIAFLDEFISNPSWQFWGVVVTILGIVIAIGLDQRGVRRKHLTYRVLSDAPIPPTPSDPREQVPVGPTSDSEDDLKKEPEQSAALMEKTSQVPDDNSDSSVVLKVWNSGTKALEEQDYNVPVHFTFPGRKIVNGEIFESEPSILKTHPNARLTLQQNSVVLPRLALNPKNSFQLTVLLVGNGTEVHADGIIIDGNIRRYVSRRLLTTTNIFLALGLILMGALGGMFLLNSQAQNRPPAGITCASGTISVDGATTFSNMVVQKVASRYQELCHAAHITPSRIPPTGSLDGLQQVNDGKLDIGVSNLVADKPPAPAKYAALVNHQIAGVIFTMVVNGDLTGVTNLSSDQIRDIYAGRYQKWSELDRRWPNIPITIVSRSTKSGTYWALQHFLLGETSTVVAPNSSDCKPQLVTLPISCEVSSSEEMAKAVEDTEGAIGYVDLGMQRQHKNARPVAIDQIQPSSESVQNGMYRFWSIEHMYTKTEPQAGSLVKAFLDYMQSDYAKRLIAESSFVDYQTLETLPSLKEKLNTLS
jgi:phosphate transport system substrate-binding protein